MTASLDSSPVYANKRPFRRPPIPFAPVEHDPLHLLRGFLHERAATKRPGRTSPNDGFLL
jgi:hypothetical protein